MPTVDPKEQGRRIEIVPAILPVDFGDLEAKIDLLFGSAKTVQVDICDGQFTRSPSWPYRKHDTNFESIKDQSLGMPEWEKIDYEFDLMVNKPEEIVTDWLSAGAARIILHAEANGDVRCALEMLIDKTEIGIAINMDTPLEEIEKYADIVDVVQLMGIDNIGFQGQTFNEAVLGRVKYVRENYPEMTISVDGGVSMGNVVDLVKAGADRLIVGSAILNSDNPIDEIAKFKSAVSL